MKVVRISRFKIGLSVLIQLLVVGALVLMANYLSFRHFKRWDLSRDQKYALSPQTKSLLASLKKPVRAVIFFSSAAEVAPDVGALLREYEFASDKKFSVEHVEPYRNFSRASELQGKYKFGANEDILILDYDGRSKFVYAAEMADFDQPDQMSAMLGQQPRLKAFKGEQAITSALVELTEGKPNKIYFSTGHGESDLAGQDLKVFSETLQRQNIQASSLNLLNVNGIPEDARCVVICGPKYDFSELEARLLSEYWNKKGRIFILLNPFAKTARLTEWLGEKGILVQDDRVLRVGKFLQMDPTTGNPEVKTGTITQAAYVVLDSKTSVTRDLEGASKQLLGPTMSLQLNKTKETATNLRLIPILESAEGFWGETENTGGDERTPFFDTQKDHMGPLILAAVAEQGGVEDSRVKVETSRLLAIGNSELLSNNGYRLSEGVSMDLALNALNWLLDREELVGIAPKEKKNIALSLNEKQLGQIALAVMAIIPGTVAIIGLLVYWRRRV